jgi:hypothetical protein
MTQRTALTLIKALGVSVRYLADTREYRLVPASTEATKREALAYYTDCPFDAVYTACELNRARAWANRQSAPIVAQVETTTAFYTDTYTIHTIADNGEGRTFKAGTLAHADTIAKRFAVAVVLCNGVQLCVWANGVLVQGAHSDRCRALDAEWLRERSANLSAESDWNGVE